MGVTDYMLQMPGYSNGRILTREKEEDKVDPSKPYYPDGGKLGSGAVQGTGSGYDMSMEDFLTLIMAQYQNQDIMNPASTDDFVNQMVQLMTIQTMTNLNDISTISYAASLVGKEVTLGVFGKDGLEEIVGVVTGTGVLNGQQVIFVDGKAYPLSAIMAIGRIPEEDKEPEEPVDPDYDIPIEGEDGVDPDYDIPIEGEDGVDPDYDIPLEGEDEANNDDVDGEKAGLGHNIPTNINPGVSNAVG